MSTPSPFESFDLNRFHEIENFIFDMDGTLTPTKSPMTEDVARLLRRMLVQGKRIAVISGSRYSVVQKHFLDQLEPTPEESERIYLLPTSGALLYVFQEGTWQCVHDMSLTPEEKQKIFIAFDQVLTKHADLLPTKVYGERVEDRGTQITMSALGNSTDAPREEKERWDPDFEKRKILLRALQEMIPEFQIQMGGSTSLDVTRAGIDKAYGIREVMARAGFQKEKTLFAGDAIFEGGTDFPATCTGIHILPVENHQDLRTKFETHMNKNVTVVAVSGGFDPVHIGHVRMFEEARALGTHLVVIVNCDDWLKRKKGYAFMPEQERAELIKKFAAVDDVYVHQSDDSHVSDALRDYKMEIDGVSYPIHIFANGGDRKNEDDIPESGICKEKNIKMVFNVGHGGKVQSSSWLTDAVARLHNPKEDVRPWGSMRIYGSTKDWWAKRITVNPGQRLSLQSHSKRSELWVCIEGEVLAIRGRLEQGKPRITEQRILNRGDRFFVGKGDIHRISSETGGTVIEVAFGEPVEDDIFRYEDDYNRASEALNLETAEKTSVSEEKTSVDAT